MRLFSGKKIKRQLGFKPLSRHFFFFRLDLPARPALSVILPWLLHAGPCGLVDKALVVSEPKIAGSSPARIKFFLVPYAAPASLDPMMLLLCKASLCLASPGLTLLLTFCTAMESTPGQDRTGNLQRVRLTS